VHSVSAASCLADVCMMSVTPSVRWCCWFGMRCRYHSSKTKRDCWFFLAVFC